MRDEFSQLCGAKHLNDGANDVCIQYNVKCDGAAQAWLWELKTRDLSVILEARPSPTFLRVPEETKQN